LINCGRNTSRHCNNPEVLSGVQLLGRFELAVSRAMLHRHSRSSRSNQRAGVHPEMVAENPGFQKRVFMTP